MELVKISNLRHCGCECKLAYSHKAVYNIYERIFNAHTLDPLILLLDVSHKKLILNIKNIY